MWCSGSGSVTDNGCGYEETAGAEDPAYDPAGEGPQRAAGKGEGPALQEGFPGG